MDYGFNDKRKSKNDKKAKARYNKYKRGGALRVASKDSKK
jgi:hypothetical protein